MASVEDLTNLEGESESDTGGTSPMLESIDTLEQLKANVPEDQEAARGASTKATPSPVRTWY